MAQTPHDSNWIKKLDIYETYFSGQLIKTYESGALSKDAEERIKIVLQPTQAS